MATKYQPLAPIGPPLDTSYAPCPFHCGALQGDVDPFDDVVPHCGRVCFVQCALCKGAGPHLKTPEAAKAAWNCSAEPLPAEG